ncbi:MAG TPA: Holliday junction resolvase RuvX [Phycisphaerales bacterium]|nr:Holliday junction resolvase RuvX [Phycisphaerales bacterium]
MRYLAIDYGSRRTGLAICDADETIVSPLRVLQGPRSLIARIAEIATAEGVNGLVVGLPLNMDGSEGPQAARTRAFARHLRERIELPVHFQDERLSSFGATEKLNEAGLSRARQKARLDAVAAAEILQAFLDKKTGL